MSEQTEQTTNITMVNNITLPTELVFNSFINNITNQHGHHKFIVKIRDLLEGLSHDVQYYILHECDNESASDAFKKEARKTIGLILESYVNKLTTDYSNPMSIN